MLKFIIKDWAGNICFQGETFTKAEEAEDYLCDKLGDEYDIDREEYYIEYSIN